MAPDDDPRKPPDSGFKEQRWHWWVSRVGIPILVSLTALSSALYINRDKIGAAVSDSPPAPSQTTEPAPDDPTGTPPSAAAFAVGDGNFVTCAMDDPAPGFGNDLTLDGEGKKILVRVAIGRADDQSDQVIRGARMQLTISNPGPTAATVSVTLTGDGVSPVEDACTLESSVPLAPVYEPGSAALKVDGQDQSAPVDDSVISGASLLPNASGEQDVGDVGTTYGDLEFTIDANSSDT